MYPAACTSVPLPWLMCPGFPHPSSTRCITSRRVSALITPVLCHLLNSDARCPCNIKFVSDSISIFHLAMCTKLLVFLPSCSFFFFCLTVSLFHYLYTLFVFVSRLLDMRLYRPVVFVVGIWLFTAKSLELSVLFFFSYSELQNRYEIVL